MIYKNVFLILCLLPFQYFSYGQNGDKNNAPLKLISRTISFNDNWSFLKDNLSDAQMPNNDDIRWRLIELPHDWSIEDLTDQIADSIAGPFSKASIGEHSTGYTVGGTGWYRKTFLIGKTDQKKEISILFDGVYMNSDVWINGQLLGNHPYGYTPFYYDLTTYLKPGGQENEITVRVRNEGKNSRWYSGSGIYRDVKLIATEKVHIIPYGVFISTPEVVDKMAKLQVTTSVANDLSSPNKIQLITSIFSPDGGKISVTKKDLLLQSTTTEIDSFNISVSNPVLWSIENPKLYKAVTEIKSGDKILDRVETIFGIRSIQVDAINGFMLNGKKLLLQGGCIHHDNGPLGAVSISRAEERKIEILKGNGFNAVRFSHNPPSQNMLDACDRLGMLVIDEAFDIWERAKNPEDYHLYFNEWGQKDLASIILRDRNHPSVIIWSFGNEIGERTDSKGLVTAKKLIDVIKGLDSTRPVTQAICSPWDNPGTEWDASAKAFALLDVGGYNYQMSVYESDHEKYPKRIMMGTESFPKLSLENWNYVEKLPYVIGDFVWTAFDYMGEASIGHSFLSSKSEDKFTLGWPWYNAWCGDIDIIGNKKPQSYYRDVVWRRSPVEMAVHLPVPDGLKEIISMWGWRDELQSWTWPGSEGKLMEVRVFSRSSLVRLKLNDNIVGEQPIADSSITAVFKVPYAPGVLKAINIKDGIETDSVVFSTAGSPKYIRLKADRKVINGNKDDLSYIMVDIVDDKGQIDPTCDKKISFSVNGAGDIAAVGNANPTDLSSFKQDHKNAFRGRCLVIIRPKGAPGKIILKAKAEGLKEGSINIIAK
jgi:beta-galactosidase